MFNRKTNLQTFSVVVLATLAVTVLVVFGALTEAVTGIETFL